jgi:hypothetical protein
MAASKGYTPPTRAELQAMRDQKQGIQPGPMMEASRRAGEIRAGLTNYAATMDKIAEAYQREDWKALGYESFNAYASGEFGEARLKLSPAHRAQILPAFVAVGMSKRAIAAALGVDDKTVRNDLRSAEYSAPVETPPLVTALTTAIEGVEHNQAKTPTGGVSVDETAAAQATSAAAGNAAADEEPEAASGLSERGSSAASGDVSSVAAGGNPQTAADFELSADEAPQHPGTDHLGDASAAGTGAADRPVPAVTPTDSPATAAPGETADGASSGDDSTGGTAAGTRVPAAQTGPEVPPPGAPASDLVDGREQQHAAGVSVPAAPGPEIPQWLTAISRFCSAAHGLDEQDPVAVRPVINADLVEELRAAIEMAHIWFLLLEDDAEKGATA